jgi:hypothetical protein
MDVLLRQPPDGQKCVPPLAFLAGSSFHGGRQLAALRAAWVAADLWLVWRLACARAWCWGALPTPCTLQRHARAAPHVFTSRRMFFPAGRWR